MTTDRFLFQRLCAGKVSGRILNIGCKEDPAGLQQTYPDRVVNLDIRTEDEDQLNNHGHHVPIPVDVIHDVTALPWPFEDAQFDLVVVGDMLEDLPDTGCQLDVLTEARRVAAHLCLTTPEDGPERDAHHQTRITETRLQEWLDRAGWRPITFETVNYGFVPRGYFVFAEHSALGSQASETEADQEPLPVSESPSSEG